MDQEKIEEYRRRTREVVARLGARYTYGLAASLVRQADKAARNGDPYLCRVLMRSAVQIEAHADAVL